MTLAELEEQTQVFITAVAAKAQGGSAATAERNNQRAILSSMLKRLAFHVELRCGNDLAVLLSSGFTPVRTNRTSEQLPTPSILMIRNGVSGHSLTTVQSSPNARGYLLQYAPVDESGASGEWVGVGFSGTSLNIPVNGMVSGRIYVYRVRSMGGLTGHSDWSDMMYHRAY